MQRLRLSALTLSFSAWCTLVKWRNHNWMCLSTTSRRRAQRVRNVTMRSWRDFVRRQKDSRRLRRSSRGTGRAAGSSLRGIGERGSAFLYCISSGAPPVEICHGVHRISRCLQVSCAVKANVKSAEVSVQALAVCNLKRSVISA